mgnify:CR=1 FL=1
MLDEAMLDTRKFWFIEPTDQLQTWRPVLNEYQSTTPWPTIEPPQKQDFLHTLLGTKDSAPGPACCRLVYGYLKLSLALLQTFFDL